MKPPSSRFPLPNRTTRAAGSDWGAVLFVWGITLGMLLGMLVAVYRYGVTIPRTDDLGDLVPVVAGEEPFSPGWLWAQHGPHRIPLAKPILWLLYKLSGFDSRLASFFSVLVLGALTCLLLGVTKRLRGHLRYADAFFPLAILSAGQWENLFWGSQLVPFVLPTLLIGVLLSIVLKGTPSGSTLWLFGACLLLIPLCSLIGFPYVVPLALWAGYLGIAWPPSTPVGDKRQRRLLLGIPVAVLILIGLYFVGFQSDTNAPPSKLGRGFVRASLQLLGMSFGQYTAQAYWAPLGLGLLGLLLVTVLLLLANLLQRPAQRAQLLGLLFFGGGVAAVVGGVGMSRSAYAWGYVLENDRYVLLMLPVLCWLYLVWEVCSPATVARFVHMCLFFLMCLLLPLNLTHVLRTAQFVHGYETAFRRDLMAGTPPSVLAERYVQFLSGGESGLTKAIATLARAGIGIFRFTHPDPSARPEPFGVQPGVKEAMIWDSSGVAQRVAHASTLTFALDKPRFVYAIRIKCSYDVPRTRRARFKLAWRKNDGKETVENDRDTYVDLGADAIKPVEATITTWIDGSIDQFSIRPDDTPCVFRVVDIAFLVPTR